MKAPLMKSVSGVRGIVGKSLDPHLIIQYATAFGHFVRKGKVVVGRDSRPSGEYYSHLVTSTLALAGCDVVDLGIVPTPTVELEVMHHKAAGGIAITASHNPAEWNALKFFGSTGEFISPSQYRRLEKILAEGRGSFVTHDRVGKVVSDEGAIGRHIKKVLTISSVMPTTVARRKYTVVVDAINGAGSQALPELLERMGVRVVRLNCKNDGDFFRPPEPTPDHLDQLGRMVRRHRANAGLACDPDADRLALVDEKGKAIGEELTLTLSVAYYLMRHKGPVAINLSTSRATADVARMVGSRVYYSRVGEANVIAEMRARKAVIGGEGNGGVILPECHYGRDALVAAGLVLSHMAVSGKRLSELAGTIPAYFNIKKKSPLPTNFERKTDRVEKELARRYGKIAVDRRDGLRFDLDEGWVQVRKSNTEPIYRLIAEGQSERFARRLVSVVRGLLT